MKRWLISCIVLVMVMCMQSMAMAATASWIANTESDLAGYNLYRAPGTCANPGAFAVIATYGRTLTSAVIANPVTDGAYCYKLTAFDNAVPSNESLFSTTVGYTHNTIPPMAPQGFTVIP